jgi:hypothetical protein
MILYCYFDNKMVYFIYFTCSKKVKVLFKQIFCFVNVLHMVDLHRNDGRGGGQVKTYPPDEI